MQNENPTTSDGESLPAAGGFMFEESSTPAPSQGVSKEMAVVTAAVVEDPSYAWGWHCNLAMAFADEGAEPALANRGAAHFMHQLFGVDTSKHAHYNPAYGSPSLPVVLPDGSSFFTATVGPAEVSEPVAHVQV